MLVHQCFSEGFFLDDGNNIQWNYLSLPFICENSVKSACPHSDVCKYSRTSLNISV